MQSWHYQHVALQMFAVFYDIILGAIYSFTKQQKL